MKQLLSLLFALLCTTAFGAEITVSTDWELRNAFIDGATVKLANDIALSDYTLDVREGITLTIDLNGFTLDRGRTSRDYDYGGQVITVRKNATLNLSNGTLTGGWGGDGGGILNEDGGSVNLTNVTITGCTGDDRGGGISNHGTMTIDGCTITGNTSKGNGGGICNLGTLTVDGCTIQNNIAKTEGGGIWTDASATLNMKGAMTVTDNTVSTGSANNLFLNTDALITVTGSLAGSSVGIQMETLGVFTSGYETNNSGVAPSTLFTPDRGNVLAVSLNASEAKLGSGLPEGGIYYIQCKWEDGKIIKETKTLSTEIGFSATSTSDDQYKVLTSNNNDIYLGTKNASFHEYYVVRGNVSTDKLIVQGPNVHIILCDKAKLESNEISVIKDHAVYIHVQSYETAMGKLSMGKSNEPCYGLGGQDRLHDDRVETGGTIEIHGGDINIKYVVRHFSAIGGDYEDKACKVNIYGGNIYAEGGPYSAGIGGSNSNDNFGEINIYGGTVEAIGGVSDGGINAGGGAGIGGGLRNSMGVVNIWGGNVTARGRHESAGIGSSQAVSGGYQGEVNIYGGIVKAYGDQYGAGIGGGDSQDGGTINIQGGEVYAYGGTDAAGIGGGEGGDGGTITITGGYVYAQGGNEYGAGIGGGQDGNGGNITITGGTVIAKAGMNETGCRAIGPGGGSDDYGSLTIGDEMMVSSEGKASAGERKSMCWYRTQARIESCTHGDVTYTVSGNGLSDTHTPLCKYCKKQYDAEQHTFVNEACTVCGVTQSSTVYTVKVYQAVARHTYGEPTTYKFLDGAKFILPTAPDKDLSNDLAFAAWVEGETPSQNDGIMPRENENLLYAGTEYIVQHDANLIARYNHVWLTLHNERHNGENLAIYNGKLAEEVILEDRTLYYDGRWNTICLPFDLDDKDIRTTPLDGATIKTLESSSFDSSTGTLTLNFTENSLTTIEAGKPYIVKWSKEPVYSDPRFSYVFLSTKLNPVKTTAAEGIMVTFAGAYSPMFIRQENKKLLYLGENNTLYYPAGAMTIGSCRAHFRLDGIEASDISETKMFLGVDSEDGINNVNVNGNGNNIFNLAGQRLSKPQKGINIVNGKKVLF